MKANELVAALRRDCRINHGDIFNDCSRACPSAVAADRIEATYAIALVRARAALDGEEGTA